MSHPILIVDDDEDILELFKLILEEEGYRVDTAVCGREAMEKASKNYYQLALLDFVLPDIKGTEIAKMLYLRKRISNVLFITGYAHIFDFIDQVVKDQCKVLLKPVSGKVLLETVRAALESLDTVEVREPVTTI